MIKKITIIIFINLFIFVALLMLINLGAVALYQFYQGCQYVARLGDDKVVKDKRAFLLNYENIEWSGKHFQELHNLSARYQSYIGWRRFPFDGETININQEGIRKTPQHESANEDSPLVVFLGGSTMWGTGVNNFNTIPSLCTDISKGKYRALNFGESGYRAFQSFLYLKGEINKGLKPDIIVSYDGVNEIFGFRKELQASSHGREHRIHNSLQVNKKREVLNFRGLLLTPIKTFVLKFKDNFISSTRKDNQYTKSMYDLRSSRTEKVAKALLDSWMSTKALAERNGALFVAVLQPNAGTGNPNLQHLKINPIRLEPYHLLYPAVLKLLDTEKYRSLKNHFIDLSNAFDGKDYIYIDHCHVSPNGNRIIAEKLLKFINKKFE